MPYEISTEVSFSAAHFIAGYPGDCARMHGHNWKVRVALRTGTTGQAGSQAIGRGQRTSGPADLAYDFRTLRALMSEVAKALDHTVLNDLACFKGRNPTAEAIAEWFYGEMAGRLADEPVSVARVEVWESPLNCAVYFKE
ncbi:MAG: 6-carboxytetrahydropterin synthase [Candidatus Eisenbacteria bacterium]